MPDPYCAECGGRHPYSCAVIDAQRREGPSMHTYRIMRVHLSSGRQYPNDKTFANNAEMYKALHDWNRAAAGRWLYYWSP